MQILVKKIVSSNRIETYDGDIIELIGLENNKDEHNLDVIRTYLRDNLVDRCVKIEMNHHCLIKNGVTVAYVYVKTGDNPEVYSMINKKVILKGLSKYEPLGVYCKYNNTFSILQSIAKEEKRNVWSEKGQFEYIGNYEDI